MFHIRSDSPFTIFFYNEFILYDECINLNAFIDENRIRQSMTTIANMHFIQQYCKILNSQNDVSTMPLFSIFLLFANGQYYKNEMNKKWNIHTNDKIWKRENIYTKNVCFQQ